VDELIWIRFPVNGTIAPRDAVFGLTCRPAFRSCRAA
jgi:hypothetical protein